MRPSSCRAGLSSVSPRSNSLAAKLKRVPKNRLGLSLVSVQNLPRRFRYHERQINSHEDVLRDWFGLVHGYEVGVELTGQLLGEKPGGRYQEPRGDV